MKKNLFKKCVGVLGAVLLLANAILPGMVAYAEEMQETPVTDDTPAVPETPVTDDTPAVPETPVTNDTPVAPVPKMLGFSKKNLTLLSQIVENEASIGEIMYATLSEAIAASTGETITILKDINLNGTITISKKVVLDLQGHKINNQNIETFEITSAGDLTIDGNGEINGPTNGAAYDSNAVITVNGGKLTFLNGKLLATGEGSDGMYGVYVLGNGTAIFGEETTNQGPTITSHFAAIGENHMTAPANVVVYGGTYEAKANPTNNEWWSYFCAPLYAAGAGSIKIEGGTFSGYYGISNRYADVEQTLDIADGVEFNASSNIAVFIDSVNGNNSAADRKITGPSNLITLPSGYTWASVDGENIAVKNETVALIGSTQYTSLTGAIAASNGETITILKDISLNETITISKKVVLDLQGHKINNQNIETFEITSAGDLTIDGNGEINGPTNGAAYDSNAVITVNGGKLTFLNGKLLATGEGSDGMYGVYVLGNGTAIFGDETTNQGPTIISHFAAIGENHMTAPANVTVYGGVYEAKANPTNNEWWSYFCAPLYAAGAGSIKIEGGTFSGYYGISNRYADVEQTLDIADGVEFNASSNIAVFVDSVNGNNSAADRKITGPSNLITLPSGYTWLKDGNNYKVAKLYTVTFNTNGGSIVDQIDVADGTGFLKPENPIKADKAFDGWYKEQELTNLWNFGTDKVSSSIVLYAKWSEPVTISFNSNGGTSVASQIIPVNSIATKPADPTRSNYNFAGWYSDSALTKVYDFNSAVTSAITLYAKWNAKSTGSTGGGGGSSYSAPKKEETKVTTGTTNTGSNSEEINLGGEVKDETTSNVTSSNSAEPTITDADIEKFGEEQIEAYKWAFKQGITTMSPVEKARLDQRLTRAELAKMMVVYIQKIKKITPLKTDEPNYSDVDSNLGDLADYIKLAYQYQIMGIDGSGNALNEFNPNGLVTRAEYATVFSRVLFGSKYNQSEGPYYEKHIAALKAAGILTNDDPTADEYRGWVMLMMYRSANTPLKATNETAKEEAKAEETTGAVAKIANPASEYCVEQGGKIEIKEDKDGGQYGICKLKDGTEVEEWEYFRANHKDEASTGTVIEATTGALAETATGTTAEVTTGTTVEAATGAIATTGAAE